MTSNYFHSFCLVSFEISCTELSVCVKKTILNDRSCSHIGILIVISPIYFPFYMFQADDHGIKEGKVNSPTCVALQQALLLSRIVRTCPYSVHEFSNCRDVLLGSLSSDVFERRTSTGSGRFALLSHDFEQIFGQIVSIRIKTLGNKNTVASRLIKREKGLLPVDVRRSKTSLLKLPIIEFQQVIYVTESY